MTLDAGAIGGLKGGLYFQGWVQVRPQQRRRCRRSHSRNFIGLPALVVNAAQPPLLRHAPIFLPDGCHGATRLLSNLAPQGTEAANFTLNINGGRFGILPTDPVYGTAVYSELQSFATFAKQLQARGVGIVLMLFRSLCLLVCAEQESLEPPGWKAVHPALPSPPPANCRISRSSPAPQTSPCWRLCSLLRPTAPPDTRVPTALTSTSECCSRGWCNCWAVLVCQRQAVRPLQDRLVTRASAAPAALTCFPPPLPALQMCAWHGRLLW